MVNSLPPDPPSESLESLRERAVRSVDVPVLLLTDEGLDSTILWANDAFVRATGMPREDLHGPALGLLYAADEDGEAVARLVASMQRREPASGVVRLRRADGTGFWSRTVLSPVRDESAELSHWVAVVLDLSQEVDRDIARDAHVAAVQRERAGLGLVSQISDLLMDLDDPYTLREIAGLLRRELVAWAAFYLNDDGLRPADGIDTDVRLSERGRRRGRSLPDDAAWVDGADAVQPLLDGLLDEPLELDLSAEHPSDSAAAWLAAHVRARVSRSWQGISRVVVLPVPGRRRVMGVLVVVPQPGPAQGRLVPAVAAAGRDIDPGVVPAPPADPDPAAAPPRSPGLAALDDATRTVLQLTVRRVGLAVDNVRLYEREHRLAETLQRAMLPEQAEVDGLDVWSYYAPNSEHAQVGGDWYDVLQITPDVVGVVIGDVVGHDVEAAAAMGQLRSVVRSYAYEVTDPGPVLERVDQLVAGMRIPRAAGLVLTTLTRTASGWDMAYSRAGHLPALHVRRGVGVLLDDAGGSLIGFGGRPRQTARTTLLPGDVLVFYTDGLIERRSRPLRDGLRELTQVAVAATATDAAGIGEELLSRLADSPEDDVAVVVVRVPDPQDATAGGLSPRSRRWLLPSEPASIGRARHAVLRTSQAWDLADVASAELVVSELVANAVLHGWGHIALRLFDTGDGLRIEVEESNPTPPVTTDGHPGRVGGYGMQIVERLADWGWRPSRGGKLVWAKLRPT
ncbi:MAG TPA: SpoIIE family protein phosphatase, partial [Cellulomonas sp.]